MLTRPESGEAQAAQIGVAEAIQVGGVDGRVGEDDRCSARVWHPALQIADHQLAARVLVREMPECGGDPRVHVRIHEQTIVRQLDEFAVDVRFGVHVVDDFVAVVQNLKMDDRYHLQVIGEIGKRLQRFVEQRKVVASDLMRLHVAKIGGDRLLRFVTLPNIAVQKKMKILQAVFHIRMTNERDFARPSFQYNTGARNPLHTSLTNTSNVVPHSPFF